MLESLFSASLLIAFVDQPTVIPGSMPQRCKNSSDQGLDDSRKRIIRIYNSLPRDKSDVSAPDHLTITAETRGRPLPVQVERYKSSTSPGRGTIIYLCGGPAACMGQRPPNVPDDFDVVVYDYIGLGKNVLSPAPPELMSVEAQAQVTKDIVRALKLKTYLIYGQSFGTTVATVAAARIGADPNMAQPRGVMLEGVNGAQRFNNGASYKRTADATWDSLSMVEKTEFKRKFALAQRGMDDESKQNTNDGLVEALWQGPKIARQALKNFMPAGKLIGGQLINKLNLVNKAVPLSIRPAEKPTTDEVQNDRMYRSAGCETMNNEIPDSPDKFFDGLVTNTFQLSNFCRCRSSKKLYDSKDSQIRAPLLYLQGDLDPATPIEGARYHFENQRSSAIKKFITVRGGGHFGTWNELAPCRSELFEQTMDGNSDQLEVSAFSNGCPAKNPSSTPTTEAFH